MAKFFPGGGGKDVWKPKKTLREWGRTEYRIIRNWTPREQREAREKQEASQHEEEEELIQGGHCSGDSESTALRPLAGGGSEEEGPGEGDRSSPEASTLASHLREDSEPEDVEALQLPRQQDSQTDSGGLVSGVSPQQVTEVDVREKEDLEVVPLEDNTQACVEEEQREQMPSGRGRGRGRGGGRRGRQRDRGGSVTMKLWQPRHVKRTKTDFHELDVCLTVYDQLVRERLEEYGEDEEVVGILSNHWKYTQKYMMAVIRDVFTAKALEKCLRKEKARQRKLQHQMLDVLQELREVSGDYHVTIAKAKEAEREKQVAMEMEEIHRLKEFISGESNQNMVS